MEKGFGRDKSLEKALSELGFSDNEARVYLLLLEHSPCFPAHVASELGVHRAYAYDVLGRLVEKGLATVVFVDGRRGFKALPPETLAEQAQARQDLIAQILPELESKKTGPKQDIHVEIRKGKNVFKHLLSDIINTLKTGDELLGLNVDERQTVSIGGFYLDRYFRIIQRRGIRERIIIPTGGMWLDAAKTTQYRQADPDILGQATTWIYANRLVFFSMPKEKPEAVFVENEAVADSYRRLFELLWEKSRPTKNQKRKR